MDRLHFAAEACNATPLYGDTDSFFFVDEDGKRDELIAMYAQMNDGKQLIGKGLGKFDWELEMKGYHVQDGRCSVQ